MKLDELFEGISPVVYHRTSLRGFHGISSTDSFRLSPTFSSTESKLGGRGFYLSTTRTRTGAYMFTTQGDVAVILTLDGRRLSNNFSGSAVDFWNKTNPDLRVDEQEDRIYSDKRTIDNASRYIQRIEIITFRTPDMMGNDVDRVISAYRWAVKKRIPVILYQSSDTYRARRSDLSIEQLVKHKTGSSYSHEIQYKATAEMAGRLLAAIRYAQNPTLRVDPEAIRLAKEIAVGKFTDGQIDGILRSNAVRDQTINSIYREMRQLGLRNPNDLRRYFYLNRHNL